MRKSGKFFEDTLYNRPRKGVRCFSVSQVYQNPEQSGFGAALSSLAQRVRAVLLDLRVYQNLRSYRFSGTLLHLHKCSHLSALLPMQSNHMRRQDTFR